jgi:glycosyltransferase involved in cell wall biosynthesis
VTARPSLLVVTSSSCQLYSGTGTVLFDWIRTAREAIDFSLMVDTGEPMNFRAATRFCREMDIPLLPSEPEQVPGCPDFRPIGIGRALAAKQWDMIECISWASAATNMEVLANRPADTPLIYTPHTQPIWTLRAPERFFMVPPIFDQMLQASDLVVVVTPWELARVPPAVFDPGRAIFIPNGVDTQRFSPGPALGHSGPPRVLTVADFREHRKRPDLLLAALDAAVAAKPDLCPVLVGRDSDRLHMSPRLVARAECLGFVSSEELVRQYRSAHVLLMLSDFEAFGIPIAEALCCGTPVIMTNQPEPLSVFGDLPGITSVENTDLIAVRDAVLAHTGRTPDRTTVAAAAAARFGLAATHGRKLGCVLSLLR